MKNDISISEVEKSTIRKLSFRILPFLILCYFIAYIDRVNIGFAALTMNQEIGLTATAFGFGATLFFIAYVIFEIPSNMAMEKLGARIWIARIMITWGIIAGLMGFIHSGTQFIILRFL
ncbi:major Facilitator Superfamily protein, partial [Acinetobacter baumannii 1277411]